MYSPTTGRQDMSPFDHRIPWRDKVPFFWAWCWHSRPGKILMEFFRLMHNYILRWKIVRVALAVVYTAVVTVLMSDGFPTKGLAIDPILSHDVLTVLVMFVTFAVIGSPPGAGRPERHLVYYGLLIAIPFWLLPWGFEANSYSDPWMRMLPGFAMLAVLTVFGLWYTLPACPDPIYLMMSGGDYRDRQTIMDGIGLNAFEPYGQEAFDKYSNQAGQFSTAPSGGGDSGGSRGGD